MKTLRQFIEGHRPYLTHEEWAARLGISRSYFTEVVSGSKKPSRRFIGLVNDLTKGKVPPQVWFMDAVEQRPNPPPVVADAVSDPAGGV